MKTTIYIDVDGVINSFRRNKLIGWTGDWNAAKIIGYRIHWYTDLVEELNRLSARDDVTFKWLTTWQDQAVTELCPVLGIEGTDWEVFYAKDDRDLFDINDWWKLDAIRDDVDATTPDKVVWIDDDIKRERESIEWSKSLPEGKIHLVSPFTDWGMTKEEFSGIIEFINAN